MRHQYFWHSAVGWNSPSLPSLYTPDTPHPTFYTALPSALLLTERTQRQLLPACAALLLGAPLLFPVISVSNRSISLDTATVKYLSSLVDAGEGVIFCYLKNSMLWKKPQIVAETAWIKKLLTTRKSLYIRVLIFFMSKCALTRNNYRTG